MRVTISEDNRQHLFPESKAHHDKYCWCTRTTVQESIKNVEQSLTHLQKAIADLKQTIRSMEL